MRKDWKGEKTVKKYRLNERGKIQLMAAGLVALLLTVAYGTIYVTAAICWKEEPDTVPLKVEMVRLEQQLEAAKKMNPNCTGSVEGMIIVACQYYGVDPDIALAIARLETPLFEIWPEIISVKDLL